MIYKHSGKWDVGASGLLGGTHIVLRPRCGSRTSRTPEWAPGTPHIASAAAIVARRGGEPAHRLSSLCRGRAGGRAGFGTPRGAARIGVALQADAEIGRASCRERGEMSGVAGLLKQERNRGNAVSRIRRAARDTSRRRT